MTNFLLLKDPIDIDYSSIFVWYFVPHIMAVFLGGNYLMDADTGGMRFCGAHVDSNFCGQLLSISLLSAYMLFKRTDGLIKRLLYGFIIVLNAILIFLTGSRGAMLSIALVFVIMLLSSSISRRLKTFIILSGVVSFFLLVNYINSLPDFVLPEDSLIDSVLCRFKSDNLEEGGGRVELWGTAVERMFDGGYYVLPLGHIAATQGSINQYTHNTILDFLVENGIIVGLIMVAIIMSTYLSLLRKVSNNRLTIWESEFVYFCICSMSQFFFISAISEKIVWIFIFGAIAIKSKYSHPVRVHSKVHAHPIVVH